MKAAIVLGKLALAVSLTFSLVILFGACDNPAGPSSSEMASQLYSMEVSDATLLFVADTNNISSSSFGPLSNSRGLYKRNENGHVQRVRGRNMADEEVNVPAPSRIITVDERYLIMVLDGTAYLISRTNERIYSMASVGLPADNQAFGGRDVYTDSAGNIYFMSSGNVFKVDVSNPDNMTATEYSPSIDTVYNFSVDSDGNMLYRHNSRFGARIRFAGGGLHNLPDTEGARSISYYGWTGYDGKLYAIKNIHGLGTADFLRWDFDGEGNLNQVKLSGASQHQSPLTFYLLEDTIVIKNTGHPTRFSIVYRKGLEPQVIETDDPLGSTVEPEKVMNIGREMVVLADNNRIYSLDLGTLNASEIYSNSSGEYDFMDIFLASTEELYFNALAMSTASVVNGMIALPIGDLTILEESSAYNSTTYVFAEL